MKVVGIQFSLSVKEFEVNWTFGKPSMRIMALFVPAKLFWILLLSKLILSPAPSVNEVKRGIVRVSSVYQVSVLATYVVQLSKQYIWTIPLVSEHPIYFVNTFLLITAFPQLFKPVLALRRNDRMFAPIIAAFQLKILSFRMKAVSVATKSMSKIPL